MYSHVSASASSAKALLILLKLKASPCRGKAVDDVFG